MPDKNKDLNLFTFDQEKPKKEESLLDELNRGISNPIPEAKTDAPKNIKHKDPVFFDKAEAVPSNRIAIDPTKFTQSDSGSAITRIKALKNQRH